MNYFKQKEFDCKCCGLNNISNDLVDKLNVARYFAGIPFIINSGTRCKLHNKDVGGKTKSSHLAGLAADIRIRDNTEKLLIVKALLKAGFTRLGIKNNYIHCDIDNSKIDTMY